MDDALLKPSKVPVSVCGAVYIVMPTSRLSVLLLLLLLFVVGCCCWLLLLLFCCRRGAMFCESWVALGMGRRMAGQRHIN